MSEATTPTQRIVPGAHPAVQVPKSQKKKRKTATKPKSEQDEVAVPDTPTAALVEQAPTPVAIKEGLVAPELLVKNGSASPVQSSNPLVAMLEKRLKASNKKILRIQGYSTQPIEKLNDDQKRNLKTLPNLEAVHKELEDVKKAVEAYEVEHAVDLEVKRAEAVRAEEARLSAALEEAQASHHQRSADLLHLIRLHSQLAAGHRVEPSLDVNESSALHAIYEDLMGESHDARVEVVKNFLTSEGEIQGVPYSRIVEITQIFANPPPVSETESIEVDVPSPTTADIVVAVAGLPPTVEPSNSFRFVQEDELEASEELQHSTSDWVQVSEAESDHVEVTEVTEIATEVAVNGHTIVEETVNVVETETLEVPPPVANTGAINWADEDEGGLPPISGLHAKFGSNEESAPEVPSTPTPATPTPLAEGVNGDSLIDEDGFTSANRGRGRGRGYHHRGGERGRGGYRGGERGGHRGGERGGYRGHRGGERGGGYRGRGSGEWRGGDGEYRGRGRGRGRGHFQEARGGAIPASSSS